MRNVICVLAIAIAGCAVGARPLSATHPAQPSAAPGRLAGAPPALRAGVVDYKDVPKTRSDAPVDHSHHK
ncbi:MAG TPA: hypothetical protein VIV11_00455 [Kofleriaceae bacterium]